MKRKAYLAALVMCMALAVNGCGNNKSEADSSDAQATEQEADTLSSKTDSEGNSPAWFPLTVLRSTSRLQIIRESPWTIPYRRLQTQI